MRCQSETDNSVKLRISCSINNEEPTKPVFFYWFKSNLDAHCNPINYVMTI